MYIIRYLLFPFSLIYAAITYVYHKLFDFGILPSKRFSLPVIGVGNLTAGGTGKTPMTEYIVNLLSKKYREKIAVLSRGYGRELSGFQLVEKETGIFICGDEPKQIKRKFSNTIVAVDGNRKRGIKTLMSHYPELKAIILDDAYQHRRVKAGLNILLTDYRKIDSRMFFLPTGDLREWKSGASRADIIVVTHTPKLFSPLERRRVEAKISPAQNQKLFFAYLEYGDFHPAYETDKPLGVNKEFYFQKDYAVLLLTGIADPSQVEYYLSRNFSRLTHIRFNDHHPYTLIDIQKIQKIFNNIATSEKIIVTTEKDVMRLSLPGLAEELKGYPVFYLPVQIGLNHEDEQEFNQIVIDYVK